MGRGTTYKYTPELLAEAAANSLSIAGVLRHLGIPWSGGMHAHISGRLKHFEIDTSHFTQQAHNRGKPSAHRLSPERILSVRQPGARRVPGKLLTRALVELGVPYRCSACGIGNEWHGQPLTLHVDHIDGNYLDCRRKNLRFLCPNCHTQTPSWAGKNKARRRYAAAPDKPRSAPVQHGEPVTTFEVLDLFGTEATSTVDGTAGVA
jgi:hypothetical protein